MCYADGVINVSANAGSNTEVLWVTFGSGGFANSTDPFTTYSPSESDTLLGTFGILAISTNHVVCPELKDTFELTVNTGPVYTSVIAYSPSTCGGIDGRIEINGLPDADYTVSLDSSDVEFGSATRTSVGGLLTITDLPATIYDSIRITPNTTGCMRIAKGPWSIADPNAPTFTVTTVDPTTCGGSDGAIKLAVLDDNHADYTVSYNDGSLQALINQQPVGDTITISGFDGSSVITSISVDSSSCVSTDAGTITFVDPNAPTFTVTTVDPTTCGGSDGAIKLAVLDNNHANYTVSYNDGSVQTITNQQPVDDTITISGFDASSVLTSISVDSSSCVTTDAGTFTFVDPNAPTFTVTTVDPTTCGGTDGAIKLAVLDNNHANYTVSYNDGSVQTLTNQQPVDDTITISGFDASSVLTSISSVKVPASSISILGKVIKPPTAFTSMSPSKEPLPLAIDNTPSVVTFTRLPKASTISAVIVGAKLSPAVAFVGS